MFTIINARKLSVLACIAASAAVAADDVKTEPVTVTVQNGTATFIANTNISAVSVKGKSTALEAKVVLRRKPDGLQLDRVEASLPVKTLLTGMSLRDEHMRKYIFTTADGKVPDIRFESSNTVCSATEHESPCQVSGMLSIRGVARPFVIPLKVREDRGGFKAVADATVKLSTYGIEQPSQFGVKTTDEVQLHFDFLAKPAAGEVAALGSAK